METELLLSKFTVELEELQKKQYGGIFLWIYHRILNADPLKTRSSSLVFLPAA